MEKSKQMFKIPDKLISEKAKAVYQRIPSVLCLIYAILSLAAVLYYTIWPAEGYFQSDCTDTIMWAQATVDGGSVFNPDFYYAALLPFSAPIWLVPLIKIFGMTMTTHVIGMVIFAILFFLSIIFVCRSMGWSYNMTYICTGSLMLLLSSSDKMREIMWGHVIYYSLGLLILFVGLGLFLRMCKKFENRENKKAYIYAALLFLFMMFGATNGLQCIAIYTLPIIGAIIAEMVFNSKEKLLSAHNAYHGFGVVLLVAATAIGLIILGMWKGNIRAGYAEAYSMLDSVANWVDNFLKFPGSYFSLFGIDITTGASLSSMETIGSVIKTVVAVVVLILPFVLLTQYKKIEERQTKILLWAHFIVFAVIMAGFVCGRLSSANWRLIPMIGTSIIASFACIREMFKIKECSLSWKRIAVIMLIIPICGSLVNFKTISNMPKDYGRDNELHELSDVLLENGLEYGYATFWRSQAITLISDSEVRVRTVDVSDSGTGVNIRLYQTNSKWYEDQEGVEKYFVLLDSGEASTANRNANWRYLKQNYLLDTIEVGNFKIFVFDRNIFTAPLEEIE